MHLLKAATSIALALAFAVIAASAYLRLDQAGLGCADWPACYGLQLMEPVATAKQAVSEQSLAVVSVRTAHRLFAAGIGMLIAIIAIVCFRTRHDWPEGVTIAAALVVLVLFLAVLGRATQGSRLPAVTLGNLLGGMAMLALLWWLRLRIVHQARGLHCGTNRRLTLWAWTGLTVLVLQVGLGAMVSTGYAAASCGTVPDCHGIWWPADWALSAFDPWHEVSISADGAWRSDPARQALHMAHRLGALITAGCLSVLALLLLRRGGVQRAWGLGLLGSLLLQVMLGLAIILFQPNLLLALLHNMVAALIVIVVVSAIFHSRPAEAAKVSEACQMVTSK
ncbi:MAG: COX15/CtaA family protein [Burkholderiales bacterium]